MLDNLKGYEHFAKEAKAGDIIVTGKNFGSGSSRQQAVDCFVALGVFVCWLNLWSYLRKKRYQCRISYSHLYFRAIERATIRK